MNNMFVGSQNLLYDVCDALKDNDFIVVGGWSPYFICKENGINHPGTKDVDLLFNDKEMEDDDWKGIIECLKQKQFIPSAKHPFQLLKEYEIERKKFLFNVDLMHPCKQGFERKEVEIIDRYDYGVLGYGRCSYHSGTINLLRSQYFFENEFNDKKSVQVQLLDGCCKQIEVQLLSPAGVIVSKAESYDNPKRLRDSLDIFVSILYGNEQELIDSLECYKEIVKKIEFEKLMEKIQLCQQSSMRIDSLIIEKGIEKVKNILCKLQK